MDRRDLVDLLYTAHGRFKSLQLSWTYRYEEEILRQLLENSSTQLLRRVATSTSDIPDAQQTNSTKIIQRRIWWQRPGCWREEQWNSENEQSVTIVCDEQSWQYSTKHKVLFTNTTGAHHKLFDSYKIERTALTPLTEDFSEHIQLLDPSFLLTSHELEVIGETVHGGREGIAVRGKYLKHRNLLFEDFFWATADEYTFIVEKEYGVLLRYAYIQDSREVAVSSVDEVIFDQPIPASVFLPGPVA
jgi:outer membrane lipoprotein-sorting protein